MTPVSPAISSPAPRAPWRVIAIAAGALTLAGAVVLASAPPGAQRAPDSSALWLVPDESLLASREPLRSAMRQVAEGRAADALTALASATRDPLIGGYALLNLGRAQLVAGLVQDAGFSAATLTKAADRGSVLHEAALALAADAADAAEDWSAAVRALEETTRLPAPAAPARAYLRLGRAADRAGNRALALSALTKVYYEHALAPEAEEATEALTRLLPGRPGPTPETAALELGRAERLYGARRFADARRSFDLVRPFVSGADADRVALRLAQCDLGLRRGAAARGQLRAYIDSGGLSPIEAQFSYLGALRDVGRHDEYRALAWAFADGNAVHPLAESALNDLATHHILADDDAGAARVFLEMYRRYPTGAFADRAAWKAGWWAYKSGDFAETIRIFESAAVALRRADYRPAWLYWAARAHARLGHADPAQAGFRRVVADYRNSYYGRAATRAAEALAAAEGAPMAGVVLPARFERPAQTPAAPVYASAPLVQALLASGMYDDAIAHLRREQRERGTSPVLEATMAYALNRQGQLRPAITAMRRAYPQFMAAGGEALPVEILKVIFPIDHRDLIERRAADHGLDPYLMLALVAQESTFQADVRSAANAWGLMQIVPDTGRRYAQKLQIRPFRTARLTEPEVNVRIGMAYFADLLKQFSAAPAALAGYNAGEHRVVRWIAERPKVEWDEFIDDIPFPETQNYVKRILGTAEDYRILYRLGR